VRELPAGLRPRLDIHPPKKDEDQPEEQTVPLQNRDTRAAIIPYDSRRLNPHCYQKRACEDRKRLSQMLLMILLLILD